MIVVSALDRPVLEQTMGGSLSIVYPRNNARLARYLDSDGSIPAFASHEGNDLGRMSKFPLSNTNISLRENYMLAV
jgi:hypothetical protein